MQHPLYTRARLTCIPPAIIQCAWYESLDLAATRMMQTLERWMALGIALDLKDLE